MSTCTWNEHGGEYGYWTLAADPRYSVTQGDRRKADPYEMRIDGHWVDSAATPERAREILAARFEYEERWSDLEEARLRLRQARERLEARYPRASRDPELNCILEGLEDAIGRGPEANESASVPTQGEGTFGRQLSPELVVGTDSSQCIVLLVGGTGPKDPIRTVTVTDVDGFKAALDDARTAQHIALEEADTARLQGPNEKRRAEGRLTQAEAVEHLAGLTHRQREAVVAVVDRARRYPRLGPERFMAAGDSTAVFLVSFEPDGYWRVVPAGTPESGD